MNVRNIPRIVDELELETEKFFGKEVSLYKLGSALKCATDLWLKGRKPGDSPLKYDEQLIPNFPDELRDRVSRVIATLEFAFNGGNEDELQLMAKGNVRITEWQIRSF